MIAPDDLVDVTRQGRTAVIRLNRPDARNAINVALAKALDARMAEIEDDDQIWAAVLTHEGPAFSAGADLRDVAAGRVNELSFPESGFAGICERTRTKPLLAAVDGAALAGGFEICLACDLLVATARSRFGLPEVKRSLVAGAGGLVRVPRALPRNLAMELALTGEPIDAVRAYHFGLVNRIAPDGEALEVALALAETINANAPLAVRASRSLVRDLTDTTEREGFAASQRALSALASTVDFGEGPRAFVEKRPPQWQGR
jgi:enoyl-CoA hydratase